MSAPLNCLKTKQWDEWLDKNMDKKDIDRFNEKIDTLIKRLKSEKDKKEMTAINTSLLTLSGAKELKKKLGSKPENSIRVWENWRKKNPKIKNMPKKEALFDKDLIYKWLKDWEKNK